MEELTNIKKYSCPLCNSSLSESRYYEIVGVWEAKKKFEDNLKKELAIAKATKEKILKEQKEMQVKLAKEKDEIKKKFENLFEKQKIELIKKAQEEAKKLSNKEKLEAEKKFKQELIKSQKEFLEKGKEHEKKRADKLSKMLEGNMEKLQSANKTINELKDQLKKGTTPQMEGLNYEEELVKELKLKFPNDHIERKGHMGDIIHCVMFKDKEVGSIVYECKKTKDFKKSYINQIKEDVANRNATYGVLVTLASEKNKSGFWVEKDIFIVHPYGAIYIAEVIRKWMIDMCSLKLSKDELSKCAEKLLNYVKSDKFKNSVDDTIHRTRELNDMLQKEVTTHKNIWEKRLEHYNHINNNVNSIDKDSNDILQQENEELELKEIEINPIIRRKKKKRLVDMDL